MKILLVEDNEDDSRAVAKVLQSAGHKVDVSANAENALSLSNEKLQSYDVAVLDFQLPGKNGLELGKTLFFQNPRLVLIMLTAYGSAERKLEAQYSGFVHFVSKPGSTEVVEMLNALKGRVEERRKKFAKLDERSYGIIGVSSEIRRIKALIATIAPTTAGVLILGESGTGKELVAKALHDSSSRSTKQFVPINCAAIPKELLESELFGHELGAFTGATKKKPGKVQEANEGTLFLDEIAEMNKELQAKMLRFLQNGSFTPVGGTKEERVEFRLVTATNQDIKAAIANKTFREDLYYRLNTVELTLPPLRERGDDILVLAQHFLNNFNGENNKSIIDFSQAAKDALVLYHWPGNIRELENVIQRAVILETTSVIQPSSLPTFSTLHVADKKTVHSAKTNVTDVTRSYWEDQIKTKLYEFDAGFPKALEISRQSGQNRVRQEDLAKALECTHPVLSNFFNKKKPWNKISGLDRLEIIALLAKNNPDQWLGLRSNYSPFQEHFLFKS